MPVVVPLAEIKNALAAINPIPLIEDELAAYRRDMESPGLRVRTTPLLKAAWIRPGTHITAVGSDTAGKQELDAAILARADRVVVDSLSQSELRGEVYKAVGAGAIGRGRLVELGRVIADENLRRASESEITVADLTGVAVQDIQVSKAVWLAVRSSRRAA
jgi:ornithine cyclodeaminase